MLQEITGPVYAPVNNPPVEQIEVPEINIPLFDVEQFNDKLWDPLQEVIYITQDIIVPTINPLPKNNNMYVETNEPEPSGSGENPNANLGNYHINVLQLGSPIYQEVAIEPRTREKGDDGENKDNNEVIIVERTEGLVQMPQGIRYDLEDTSEEDEDDQQMMNLRHGPRNRKRLRLGLRQLKK